MSSEFKPGDIIIKEGAVDHCAYMIEKGRVEVFNERNGKQVKLSELGRGQIFGEMGLITEQPRTASVRALEPTAVRQFDIDTFNRLLHTRPDEVIPILRGLFERLRTLNSRYAEMAAKDFSCDTLPPGGLKVSELKKSGQPASVGESAEAVPVLRGKTKMAAASLPEEKDLRVTSFPFKIGRASGGTTSELFSDNDLTLEEGAPFSVSRNHCSIDKHPDGNRYFVEDRGSSQGTIVNGKPIGGSRSVNRAELDRKKNEIVIGPEDSPFRYEIIIK